MVFHFSKELRLIFSRPWWRWRLNRSGARQRCRRHRILPRARSWCGYELSKNGYLSIRRIALQHDASSSWLTHWYGWWASRCRQCLFWSLWCTPHWALLFFQHHGSQSTSFLRQHISSLSSATTAAAFRVDVSPCSLVLIVDLSIFVAFLS